jgi:hypothetical protein
MSIGPDTGTGEVETDGVDGEVDIDLKAILCFLFSLWLIACIARVVIFS